MANVATSEAAARRILGRFAKTHCEAGDVLRGTMILADFSGPPWGGAEMEAGLNESIRRGWLGVAENGAYKLTQEGVAIAFSSPAMPESAP